MKSKLWLFAIVAMTGCGGEKAVEVSEAPSPPPIKTEPDPFQSVPPARKAAAIPPKAQIDVQEIVRSLQTRATIARNTPAAANEGKDERRQTEAERPGISFETDQGRNWPFWINRQGKEPRSRAFLFPRYELKYSSYTVPEGLDLDSIFRFCCLEKDSASEWRERADSLPPEVLNDLRIRYEKVLESSPPQMELLGMRLGATAREIVETLDQKGYHEEDHYGNEKTWDAFWSGSIDKMISTSRYDSMFGDLIDGLEPSRILPTPHDWNEEYVEEITVYNRTPSLLIRIDLEFNESFKDSDSPGTSRLVEATFSTIDKGGEVHTRDILHTAEEAFGNHWIFKVSENKWLGVWGEEADWRDGTRNGAGELTLELRRGSILMPNQDYDFKQAYKRKLLERIMKKNETKLSL